MLVTNNSIVIIMTNPHKNSLSNQEVMYIRKKKKEKKNIICKITVAPPSVNCNALHFKYYYIIYSC